MNSAGSHPVTGSTSFIQQQEAEVETGRGEDQLVLYGQSFTARLLLGTARYDSPSLLADAIAIAGPAMLTVSLRRQVAGSAQSGQAFWNLLRANGRTILPNTAGCFTAREAVKTACMARELFETNLIKLEVIGDEVNLQPDPFGLVEAAVELVRLRFQVLPYCTEDWVLCRRLMDAGCEVLMPWAAPIGTGQGPRNPRALRELRERAAEIPLIVDAGIGLPSHACQVMEWGFDGVLLNTAVSRALDPVRMAGAFASAVRAGRAGFLAGPMTAQDAAAPSTPELGRPFTTDPLQLPVGTRSM
jgi:thiazole synthase